MLRVTITLTASLGIEPRMHDSKSYVLPITPQGNIWFRSRSFKIAWNWRESNSQPIAYEAITLAIELQFQSYCIVMTD